MIKALAPKWSAIECSYILTAKHVFQMMRTEQETHCHYFYDRRSELTQATFVYGICTHAFQNGDNFLFKETRLEARVPVSLAKELQCSPK